METQTQHVHEPTRATAPALPPTGTEQPLPAFPDEDDDSPDAIFLRAIAGIPTQPLGKAPQQRTAERHVLPVIFVVFLSFVGGTVLGLVTYPTVTVTLLPVQKARELTAPLALPTRALPQVTVTKTLSVPTTGRGHQDAKRASGILTFYNGSFSSLTVVGGTRFTGTDRVIVTTDQAIIVPAATPSSPPQFGQASVSAHALQVGRQGNIAAGDLNMVAQGLLVKNGQFSGGSNARSYQAVAQRDIDTLSATLEQDLSQAIPQAFVLPPGEAVVPTVCHLTTSADHSPGVEARRLTLHARETCIGVAYSQDTLRQQATALFRIRTRPGTQYQLVWSVTAQVISVTPLLVRIHGIWVYMLSQDEEQLLAQHIAGDSAAQAIAYLLKTGVIARASVLQPLPKDPGHIRFQIPVGL